MKTVERLHRGSVPPRAVTLIRSTTARSCCGDRCVEPADLPNHYASAPLHGHLVNVRNQDAFSHATRPPRQCLDGFAMKMRWMSSSPAPRGWDKGVQDIPPAALVVTRYERLDRCYRGRFARRSLRPPSRKSARLRPSRDSTHWDGPSYSTTFARHRFVVSKVHVAVEVPDNSRRIDRTHEQLTCSKAIVPLVVWVEMGTPVARCAIATASKRRSVLAGTV